MIRFSFDHGLRLLLIVSVLGGPALAQEDPASIGRYNARYHVVFTDLPKERVIETVFRLNAMAETYYQRTKGFAGKIRQKLPFFLYSDYTDYMKALDGRMMGSVGVYTGKELRAAADFNRFDWDTIWSVIQHEGFHQFVHMVISRGNRDIPIWVNEGLAEYFGSAVWTGDSLVTGLVDIGKEFKRGDRDFIRQGRLQRVQDRIRAGQFKPFEDIITMSHSRWNREMDAVNYDQVWYMMHFFVHAKDGKYRQALGEYIEDVSEGKDNARSFVKYFGRDVDALKKECDQWWLDQADDPSPDERDQVMLEILLSFLARAQSDRMEFDSAEAFLQACRDGKCDRDLKSNPRLWLPDTLLDKALQRIDAYPDRRWELIQPKGQRFASIRMTREDGTILEIKADRPQVHGSLLEPVMTVTRPDPASQPASQPSTQPARDDPDQKPSAEPSGEAPKTQPAGADNLPW